MLFVSMHLTQMLSLSRQFHQTKPLELLAAASFLLPVLAGGEL